MRRFTVLTIDVVLTPTRILDSTTISPSSLARINITLTGLGILGPIRPTSPAPLIDSGSRFTDLRSMLKAITASRRRSTARRAL